MQDKIDALLKTNKNLSQQKIKKLTKLLKEKTGFLNADDTKLKIATSQKDFKPVTNKYLNRIFAQL